MACDPQRGEPGKWEISETFNLQEHHRGEINIGQAALFAREEEDRDKISRECYSRVTSSTRAIHPLSPLCCLWSVLWPGGS